MRRAAGRREAGTNATGEDEAWVLFGPTLGLKRSLARRAAMKSGFFVFPEKFDVNSPKVAKQIRHLTGWFPST
jgi:hypothetical protein